MLAAVNHPTIAAIYGAEEDGSTRYIVMELVEGETLAERLSGGALPVADALRIGAGIAEALEVAHEKGVIHRDLKPANIKLNREGKVKVLDFGLAKAMDLPFAGDMSRTPTLVMDDSRPGDIVGTPEFMSPEQARGKETDRRTDIWAFGCILFEMLTGKRAFTGETIPDALLAILDREPDWAALPVRTPPRVRELLARCLEKDPARRLRDAGDARLELEAALAGLSGAGGPLPPVRRRHAREDRSRRRPVRSRCSPARVLHVSGLEPAGPSAALRQLAVLPFRNLTGSPEGELWGLGMVETVSARLADVPGLQVVTPRAAVEAVEDDPNFAQRRAAARRERRFSPGPAARERTVPHHVSPRRREGACSSPRTRIDGSELFALQDRVADGVVSGTCGFPGERGARRRPRASTRPRRAGAVPRRRSASCSGTTGARASRRRSGSSRSSREENGPTRRSFRPLSPAPTSRCSTSRRSGSGPTGPSPPADAAAPSIPGLPEVDVDARRNTFPDRRPKEAVRRVPARPRGAAGTASRPCWASAAPPRRPGTRRRRRTPSAARSSSSPPSPSSISSAFYYASAAATRRPPTCSVEATEPGPTAHRAFSNLGGAETMRCDFPAALAAFRRRSSSKPERSRAPSSNLGMTQLWTGHAAEAVASLERARHETPRTTTRFGNLVRRRAVRGERERAAKAYARAIALARAQLEPEPEGRTAHAVLGAAARQDGEPRTRRARRWRRRSPSTLRSPTCIRRCGHRRRARGPRRRGPRAGCARPSPRAIAAQILARQPEFARFRESRSFVDRRRAAQGGRQLKGGRHGDRHLRRRRAPGRGVDGGNGGSPDRVHS